MTTAADDPPARRRRIVRVLVIGVLLLVPRFALAFLAGPATDAAQLLATLLLVAGTVVIASALTRLWLLRSSRLLPVAAAGVAALLVAGIVTGLRPPGGAQVAYQGGLLAPLPAALYSLFYLALAALSQLGLFLLLGAFGLAVSRWAARRAA